MSRAATSTLWSCAGCCWPSWPPSAAGHVRPASLRRRQVPCFLGVGLNGVFWGLGRGVAQAATDGHSGQLTQLIPCLEGQEHLFARLGGRPCSSRSVRCTAASCTGKWPVVTADACGTASQPAAGGGSQRFFQALMRGALTFGVHPKPWPPCRRRGAIGTRQPCCSCSARGRAPWSGCHPTPRASSRAAELQLPCLPPCRMALDCRGGQGAPPPDLLPAASSPQG